MPTFAQRSAARPLAVLICILALGACGRGGGGGGGAGGSPSGDGGTTRDPGGSTNTVTTGPAPVEDLSGQTEACVNRAALAQRDTLINDGNYVSLASGAFEAFAGFGTIERLVRRHVYAAHTLGPVGDPALLVCDAGNIDRSYADVDANGQLSSGDSMTLKFNQCVQKGVTRNGQIEFANMSRTDYATLHNISGDVTVQGFSESASGGSATTPSSVGLQGRLSVNIMPSQTQTQLVSSTGMVLTWTDGSRVARLAGTGIEGIATDSRTATPGNSLFVRSARNVRYTAVGVPPAADLELVFDAQRATAFISAFDGPYASGTLSLTAADGSKATLLRETSSRSRVSLDLNGDGVVEQSCLTN